MDELAKQRLLDDIKDIQETPTPLKWRKAHDFARKVNPEVRQEQDQYRKELNQLRKEQRNKFASAEKSGLRFGLSIPVTTVTAIRAFDPDFLNEKKNKNTGHGSETNTTVRQLMKLFPEYRIPEVV